MPRRFTVALNARFCLSQPKLGVDKAPDYFIEAGLPQQLTELGWAVKFDGHLRFEETDVQNDTPIGKLKNPRLVSSVCKTVAQAVGEHAKQGRLPVTLGGDHSLVCSTREASLLVVTDLILSLITGYGYYLGDA